MTQRSSAATAVARRLWARAAGGTTSPEAVAEAAERTCTQLYAGLGRWIGTMGYRTLLDRALVLARAEHPALGSLACLGGDQPVPTATQPAHSGAEVAAGMVVLMATLVESLGRIIGEEMAVRLVEQTGMDKPAGPKKEPERKTEPAGRAPREQEGPSPRGVVATESRGGPDARVG